MRHEYKTNLVCSTKITFDLDGDKVKNIEFTNGCNGNLKAISKIVDGWTVDEINEKLAGNLCGRRPTSCADQLAIAVKKAYEEERMNG
ncbi:TIGR03905 family TSCPD domain-containing protein [bacterium]|nr:TIGR03905 family TSCPD domain-containing protein [bacterium]